MPHPKQPGFLNGCPDAPEFCSRIGSEALAAMIVYLVVMVSCSMACRSQKATSAAQLRLIFAAWAAGEAVLGAVALM